MTMSEDDHAVAAIVSTPSALSKRIAWNAFQWNRYPMADDDRNDHAASDPAGSASEGRDDSMILTAIDDRDVKKRRVRAATAATDNRAHKELVDGSVSTFTA